jgi:hypothetical protein
MPSVPHLISTIGSLPRHPVLEEQLGPDHHHDQAGQQHEQIERCRGQIGLPQVAPAPDTQFENEKFWK